MPVVLVGTYCLVWVSLLLMHPQRLINRMKRCKWKPPGFTVRKLHPRSRCGMSCSWQLWFYGGSGGQQMFTCLTTVAVKLLKRPMNSKGPPTLAAFQWGRSPSDVFVYTSNLISSQKTQAVEPPLFSRANNFILWWDPAPLMWLSSPTPHV